MASSYKRTKSRYYWITYIDPASGERVRESSGIDWSLPGAKDKIKALIAEKTSLELAAPKCREKERWDRWTQQYAEQRYANPKTLVSARQAIDTFMKFCRAHGVAVPRQLTYEHVSNFVPWCMKNLGLSHNTSRMRLAIFSAFIGEALRRGMVATNVIRGVRVRKKPCKIKPEITIEDERQIEEALAKEDQWMRDCWIVLMRQGCRVSEAFVPLERIDTSEQTITFRIKGGRNHTAPLHPDVIPIVERARKAGRELLIEQPPSASACWCNFYKKIGLPYSAHCCRVTVITRLLRAGHSPAKVAAFIGHTEEIQIVYRRLKPPDVRDLLGSLGAASSSSKGNGQE